MNRTTLRTAPRAIAVFAKEPAPGRVKTRLVPPLTHAQAAQLAHAFLIDSNAKVERVAQRTSARVVVYFTPPEARERFRAMLGDTVELRPQCDGDLTQRLKAAYRELQADGCSAVCFVGADSPTLPEHYVEAALDALCAANAVAIGPATDGGYYLLALAAPHLALFDNITWSTPYVFDQTCAAARRLHLQLTILPAWYDVDDADGLRRLTSDLGPSARQSAADACGAPRTRELLLDQGWETPTRR